MVEYPIRVRGVAYRGSNAAKRAKVNRLNSIASDLERGINAMIEKQDSPISSYMYGQIAAELGVPVETVRELCMSIDGGHNGFTVARPGMTCAQALAAVDAMNKTAGGA